MKHQNIILIVIDALRADHLGIYGYNRKTSPTIDKLAKNGVLFENAFSCTNATDPSITTILSGKYPVSHGIRNHGPKVTNSMIKEFYNRKIKFLSEILRNNNYNTFGMDWLGRWHKKGFEYYLGEEIEHKRRERILKTVGKLINKFPHSLRESVKKAYRQTYKKVGRENSLYNATELVNKSIELLTKANQTKLFFLFIHFWDTHTPYNAPEDIYVRFKPPKREGETLKELLANIGNKEWKKYLLSTLGEQMTTKEIIAMYDSAIRYVDQEIERLIDFLKDKGMYENTIFVITSDHGESLTEHGIFFDHHGLYDESIRVPLIFSNIPIEVERKRVKNLVQHIDVVPTLLDILNISFNKSEFDGIPLAQIITGETNFSRPFAVAEESYTEKKIAIRTREWKYIYSPSKEAATCRYCGIIHGGVEELYHLERDPNEMYNLVKERSEIAKELKKKLFTWMNYYDKRYKNKYEYDKLKKAIKNLKLKGKI